MTVALSTIVRRAISDARLSADEVGKLRAGIRSGQIKGAELELLAARYGDLFEVGAGSALVEVSPASAHVVLHAPIRSTGDTYASARVLTGHLTLSKGSTSREAVMTYQRALIGIASRLGKPGWALPKYGADGDFGNEMLGAVTAFQRDSALRVTGSVDQATGLAIEQHLVEHSAPDIGGITGPSSPAANGERIAQAALDLIGARAADYGLSSPWRSPNPAIPGNDKPGISALGAVGRWKCNLFGLDSLFLGGAVTPHYPGGNYPIAVEIPNYTRGPSDPLIKLGEVWPEEMTPAEAKSKIEALLKIARPGDVIIVNHPGTETADGGHTRVVVSNTFSTTGTVDCAQAGSEEALVRAETVSSFTSEEAFYLLRPSQNREDDFRS